MSEGKSTTPDPVALVRQIPPAINRGDLDAFMRVYDPDAVWDLTRTVLVSLRGRAAIRSFPKEWIGAFERLEFVFEELLCGRVALEWG
jgi:ketosteroid isomerase-like protein